jgi:hypothetical protein
MSEVNVELFTPHEGQLSIIDGFADSPHKFGTVVTGRQFGKTLLAENLMIYWLLSKPKQKGAWISPIYNQVKKVFDEILNASNSIIQSSNKADLTLKFINGSTLQFLSAERYDSIRGFSFNYVVVDEAGFVKEPAINEAILPTLTAIGKKCLFISTPKGKNWFYNTYLKGNIINDNHISFRAPSLSNPYVDKEFIENQRLSLPQDIFQQEYEAMFTDGGSEVFRGVDKVSILSQWNTYNKTERCFIGIDTGISSDYSVLTVINEVGVVQQMVRMNGENIQTIANTFISVLNNYNIAGGSIETNGIGRAMADLIIPSFRNIKEFTTTQDSKTQLVRTLIEDIEQQRIELPTKELMPELYNELNLFTYKLSTNGKLSFGHPTGGKDDMVDSLMLANSSRSQIQQLSVSFGGRKGRSFSNPSAHIR